MARRGDGHRLMRWLWTSRRIDARLARLALLPASGLWQAGMRARAQAFRRGWFSRRELPLPAVAVGNLTVGGSGKTPIATWIARHYAAQGLRPGILLRGHGSGPAGGSDEARVHAHDVPEAVVIPHPDRVEGAVRAAARGAQVLVLDDAYQRLDVWRDLNLLLVAAESDRAVRWPLPAGPWRETWQAMDRADAVIVTRKRADAASALDLARRIAGRTGAPVAIVHLHLFRLQGMISGTPRDAAMLEGTRVVAASAIADPDAFVSQVKRTGAHVQVATWKDHHDFQDVDLAWLARAARKADHLVVTQKDAVKLRDRWPASVPEPLVAVLDPVWEEGEQDILRALDAVVAPV